ncbi:MAG: hypothetical protein JWR19_1098, partial [Pedosphaera sp.]|nr:hypothetical protein [Pedosphaera sp.]
TFGILPDFSGVLSPVPFAHLDDHRFGFQAPADEAHLIGTTWINQQWGMSVGCPSIGSIGTNSTESSLSQLPYYCLDRFPNGNTGLPPDLNAYQSYMQTVGQVAAVRLTKQFPTQAHNYYQITWEPGGWTSAADMVTLYQTAYQALHAGDSNAIVLGTTDCCMNDQVGEFNWLGPAGIWQWLDGISFHGYIQDYLVQLGKGPDEQGIVGMMRNFRSLLAQHMPAHFKMVCSELSYGYPNAPTATYPDTLTLDMHAVYNMRSHIILLGEGANTSFFFFGADYVYENGFGFYFNLDWPGTPFYPNDTSPKPTAMAGATLVRLLDHTTSLGAIQGLPADVTGYLFRDASGKVIAALWAHNTTFSGSDTINLPVAAAGAGGSVNLVDMMGNITTASYANGQLPLMLGETPVYVIANGTATNFISVLTPAGL